MVNYHNLALPLLLRLIFFLRLSEQVLLYLQLLYVPTMATVNPCVIKHRLLFSYNRWPKLYVGAIHLSFESSFSNKEEDRICTCTEKGSLGICFVQLAKFLGKLMRNILIIFLLYQPKRALLCK